MGDQVLPDDDALRSIALKLMETRSLANREAPDHAAADAAWDAAVDMLSAVVDAYAGAPQLSSTLDRLRGIPGVEDKVPALLDFYLKTALVPALSGPDDRLYRGRSITVGDLRSLLERKLTEWK